MKRLEVSVQDLLTWTGLPACGANQRLLRQVRWVMDGGCACVNGCTLAPFVKEIAIPDSNVVRSRQAQLDCGYHLVP